MAKLLASRMCSPAPLVRFVAEQALMPGLAAVVPEKLRLPLLRTLADNCVAYTRVLLIPEEDAAVIASALCTAILVSTGPGICK